MAGYDWIMTSGIIVLIGFVAFAPRGEDQHTEGKASDDRLAER